MSDDIPEPILEKTLKYALETPRVLAKRKGADSLVLRVPTEIAVLPEAERQEWLHMMALAAVHHTEAETGPYEITDEDWLVSNNVDEVGLWIPKHDCSGCWAAMTRAKEIAQEKNWVALCNLQYVTYQAPNVVAGSTKEGWVPDDEAKRRFASALEARGIRQKESMGGIPTFALESMDDLPAALDALAEVFGKEKENPE